MRPNQAMQAYPIKTKDTAHRVLSDEAIVVNFKNSFFYSLNPVGTFIWERCDGRHSLAQIAQEVAEEYEVAPEEAARDCREFIDSLVEQGLLHLGDGAES
jgi:methyltransferase-like protein